MLKGSVRVLDVLAPAVILGGVDGFVGGLKAPSLVAVAGLCLLLVDSFRSSLTSSFSMASAYFLDIILNRSFF